ncbi:HEPN domain-containing protein [Candidatus Uhrbacteria bacterium]|nr:HEPN domain-containing protein [Candidatus Uhrbacteria bacterium]
MTEPRENEPDGGLDEEAAERALRSFWEIYVQPEVTRRQAEGRLPVPAQISRAQVLFYPDERPNEVRLNEEVRAKVRVTLREGRNRPAGSLLRFDEIASWEGIDLARGDDLDAGHITFVVTPDGGQVFAFDAVYNKRLAAEHLAAAREFLDAATAAVSKGHARAALDTLFSAAELAAKATLLTMPDPAFQKSKKHGVIHARFNRRVRWGNGQPELAATLNRLRALRPRARYLEEPLGLGPDEMVRHLATVQAMIDHAARIIDRTGHDGEKGES